MDASVEWVPVDASGCLGGVVACPCLWLLGLRGFLWLPVAVKDEWLPVLACGC